MKRRWSDPPSFPKIGERPIRNANTRSNFMGVYQMRGRAQRLLSWVSAATLAAITPAVLAQQAPSDTHDLDEIVVIGVTPVPGFKIDKDKIPGSIQTLRSS